MTQIFPTPLPPLCFTVTLLRVKCTFAKFCVEHMLCLGYGQPGVGVRLVQALEPASAMTSPDLYVIHCNHSTLPVQNLMKRRGQNIPVVNLWRNIME